MFTSSAQNSNLWMTLQRVKDIALGKLESIDLYAVVDPSVPPTLSTLPENTENQGNDRKKQGNDGRAEKTKMMRHDAC